jgi:hypothetical protein
VPPLLYILLCPGLAMLADAWCDRRPGLALVALAAILCQWGNAAEAVLGPDRVAHTCFAAIGWLGPIVLGAMERRRHLRRKAKAS